MLSPGFADGLGRSQCPNKERGEDAEQQAENNPEGVRAHNRNKTAKHTSGSKSWLGATSGHCRHSGAIECNNATVAQTQPNQAPRLAALAIIRACCIFPTALRSNTTQSAAAFSRRTP